MVWRRCSTKFIAAVVCVLPTVAAEAAGALGYAAAEGSIRAEDLQKHVNVLASDTFEGREAGSRGGKAAGVYLVKQLRKIGVAGAEPSGGYYQVFGPDFRNILAVVPGSDPKLKQEYVIVCAHYDHVGYGTPRNSLGPIGYIHNGADDNASGTAGLMELAEAFSLLAARPKRSILFTLWDAEEKGLLGSEHWLEHPTVPLRRVRLLLNLDMIGRMRNSTVTVYGVRTGWGFRRLVSEQNREGKFQLDFDWNILRDSDHHPFYVKRVPYLMLYTGKHADYHRPTDDVDKLNIPGMQQITRVLFGIAHEAADRTEFSRFRAASDNEDESAHRRMAIPLDPLPARLGASWNGKLAAERIVTLTTVQAGSPAARAGLQVGDRILEFGGHRVEVVADFRELVYIAHNPVPVLVERDGAEKPLKLTVHLNGQPLRLGIAWRVDPAEPGCVILARIAPGSPADRAGLEVTDRIHAVAGRQFADSDEFRELIHLPDNPLEMLVERHGRIRTVRLKFFPEPAARQDDRAEP